MEQPNPIPTIIQISLDNQEFIRKLVEFLGKSAKDNKWDVNMLFMSPMTDIAPYKEIMESINKPEETL